MRQPGVDYVYIFKAFPLVPLETAQEHAEAVGKMAWLESRTEPTKSTLDFKYVLCLLIKDYEDREASKPSLAETIQMLEGGSEEEDTMYRGAIGVAGRLTPSGTKAPKRGRPIKECS